MNLLRASQKHRFRKLSFRERKNLRNGLLFISPWIIGFTGLTLYPIISSFYYSLTQYSGLGAPNFVGFRNYSILFSRDPMFWTSVGNTLYMVLLDLPAGIVAGVLIAMLLNMKIKGQGLFRTIFFLPSIIPAIGATILFLWIFNPEYGLANAVLHFFGLHGVGWFVSPRWSKPSLIVLDLWGVGGSTIIYLANLQDIPASLYDAAAVDGAGSFRRFTHITLPMLTPSIFFNLVMGFIAMFNYFTQAFVATSGGPYNSTLFYALYLFNQAFVYFNLGYASAMAWVLFAVVMIITIILFRTSWRWVFYAGEN